MRRKRARIRTGLLRVFGLEGPDRGKCCAVLAVVVDEMQGKFELQQDQDVKR